MTISRSFNQYSLAEFLDSSDPDLRAGLNLDTPGLKRCMKYMSLVGPNQDSLVNLSSLAQRIFVHLVILSDELGI